LASVRQDFQAPFIWDEWGVIKAPNGELQEYCYRVALALLSRTDAF